jgi:glycosylphosphatidylinositol transamidase (GPIT) subunit GPI8
VAKRVAKGAAKGAAKGVMGAGKLAAKTAGLGVKSYRGLNNINANSNARFESIVFEGKVSDVVIRDFFSALLDTFGEQETSEGFYRDNSYILENFMNVELSEIGMRHIIEMIDGHNRSGELDKLKRNVICKMSINEEATLGDIRKELMELQHVAHKL